MGPEILLQLGAGGLLTVLLMKMFLSFLKDKQDSSTKVLDQFSVALDKFGDAIDKQTAKINDLLTHLKEKK